MQDLAARNVMVGDNEVCKVADFGLLRELDDYQEVYISSNMLLCLLRWMAPESVEHKQFSTASDVWSYGILLWGKIAKFVKVFSLESFQPYGMRYWHGSQILAQYKFTQNMAQVKVHEAHSW